MSSNGGKNFPVFVRREMSSKVDTFGSFADDISIEDVSGALSDVKEMPYSPTASTSSGASIHDDNHSDHTTSTAVASPTQPPAAPTPAAMDMSDMDVTFDMSILDRM